MATGIDHPILLGVVFLFAVWMRILYRALVRADHAWRAEQVFAIGGVSAGSVSVNLVEAYDLAAGAWVELPRMRMARGSFAALEVRVAKLPGAF